MRQVGQKGNRHAPTADLVGGDHLLRNPQQLAELRLGEVLRFAGFGDAAAELPEEHLLVVRHVDRGEVEGVHTLKPVVRS